MNKTTTLFAILLAALASGAPAAEARLPLAVAYPKPNFHGTYRPFKVANLEPKRDSAPEILVPRGTILLSRGRPVTASDAPPLIGELAFITDGDKTGIDGAVVELGPGPQWVQIDLGQSATIHAIAVWHFHSQERVYHDVVVQISDDPTFTKGTTTVFNNDQDNSSKLGRGRDRAYIETHLGRLIDARGAAGRYVRLASNGNTSDELNHYCEVEVFGERKG